MKPSGHFYCPPTKLCEGNIFTSVGLFTGGCGNLLEADTPVGRPPWKEHGTRQEVTSYPLEGTWDQTGSDLTLSLVLTSSDSHQSRRYPSSWNAYLLPPPKQSLRRLCFYTCLSLILFTGGCLVPGGLVSGMPGPGGGAWARGVPGPGGVSAPGGSAPGGGCLVPLQQALRILLECILV